MIGVLFSNLRGKKLQICLLLILFILGKAVVFIFLPLHTTIPNFTYLRCLLCSTNTVAVVLYRRERQTRQSTEGEIRFGKSCSFYIVPQLQPCSNNIWPIRKREKSKLVKRYDWTPLPLRLQRSAWRAYWFFFPFRSTWHFWQGDWLLPLGLAQHYIVALTVHLHLQYDPYNVHHFIQCLPYFSIRVCTCALCNLLLYSYSVVA